ncbi:MAG: hypothetical protein JKY53_00185 [Flavobacteriales bacterium]|nr:hypothetical protein [Flavobacteriales bacterium]
MASVDPFVIEWPEVWTEDPQIAPVIIYLNRFLHDLWIRSGGGDDAIAETQIGELYEPGIQTSNVDEIAEELEIAQEMAFNPVIAPVELITIAAGVTAFTTTGNQIIICNNTAELTITLNLNPDDGEKITVIRRDAKISLVGTLNGSTPTAIPSKNDILDVYHTIAGGEWSA